MQRKWTKWFIEVLVTIKNGEGKWKKLHSYVTKKVFSDRQNMWLNFWRSKMSSLAVRNAQAGDFRLVMNGEWGTKETLKQYGPFLWNVRADSPDKIIIAGPVTVERMTEINSLQDVPKLEKKNRVSLSKPSHPLISASSEDRAGLITFLQTVGCFVRHCPNL